MSIFFIRFQTSIAEIQCEYGMPSAIWAEWSMKIIDASEKVKRASEIKLLCSSYWYVDVKRLVNVSCKWNMLKEHVAWILSRRLVYWHSDDKKNVEMCMPSKHISAYHLFWLIFYLIYNRFRLTTLDRFLTFCEAFQAFLIW